MYLDSDSTCPPKGVVGEKSIDFQPGSSGLPSTGTSAKAAVDTVSCADVRWCCDAAVLFVYCIVSTIGYYFAHIR